MTNPQTQTPARSRDAVPSPLGGVTWRRAVELSEADRTQVLRFLAERPVHTVVMASYIEDNGVVSELNRGKFFGYRNTTGVLEGVALIGHTTLVEARSPEALRSFAVEAKRSATPIHLIMSSGDNARTFWDLLKDGLCEPRLACTEMLFEASFPFFVQGGETGVRLAQLSELIPVAEAQAEVAFIESGVDPMLRDREGFLKRVARRIEQGRIHVVFDGDELVFKTDVIAQTSEVAYLEGVYVAEKHRGRGIGPKCLAAVTIGLLSEVSNVCLLSNLNLTSAHRSFEKAGYKSSDTCTTLFV
jgi:GNAT superfamily N-acetyltransferase